MTRYARQCRKCRAPLRGVAYLQLAMSAPGDNTLCLSCVDRMMGAGGYDTVRDLTVAYAAAERPPTDASLRARVAELERLLDQLTRPS